MAWTGEWTGGCLCGAVRYRASEVPHWAAYCHCDMCKKASGAPFASFVEFPKGAVEWLQGEMAAYQSSSAATRRFCGTCGSQLTFEADGGFVFIALGSLDHPEQVEVQRHCYTSSRLPGLAKADQLPEFAGPVGDKGGLPIE